jgi:hypothetical protein
MNACSRGHALSHICDQFRFLSKGKWEKWKIMLFLKIISFFWVNGLKIDPVITLIVDSSDHLEEEEKRNERSEKVAKEKGEETEEDKIERELKNLATLPKLYPKKVKYGETLYSEGDPKNSEKETKEDSEKASELDSSSSSSEEDIFADVSSSTFVLQSNSYKL